MEVREALQQVAEMRRFMLTSAYYRGYRSPVMAATSIVGLSAAAFQPWMGAAGDDAGFVRYWLMVAAVNLMLVTTDIVVDYLPRLSRPQQCVARTVVAQFIPSLCGAALAAWACTRVGATALLPGLWCVMFSHGIFASRPYLPRGVGWVGLFYMASGAGLLALAAWGGTPQPWWMGAPFGVGQMLLALALYWDLERSDRHGV